MKEIHRSHLLGVKRMYTFSTALISPAFSKVVMSLAEVKAFGPDGLWFHPRIVL